MKIQHYYADPIGTGEFSRNRFRPVCDPFAQPIHIPPAEQHGGEPDPDRPICETCEKVRVAMLDLGVTR